MRTLAMPKTATFDADAYPGVTDAQREILRFLASHVQENGAWPTFREIGQAFGIKSPNGVQCHLSALKTKGIVKLSFNKARSIEIVGWRLQLVREATDEEG